MIDMENAVNLYLMSIVMGFIYFDAFYLSKIKDTDLRRGIRSASIRSVGASAMLFSISCLDKFNELAMSEVRPQAASPNFWKYVYFSILVFLILHPKATWPFLSRMVSKLR